MKPRTEKARSATPLRYSIALRPLGVLVRPLINLISAVSAVAPWDGPATGVKSTADAADVGSECIPSLVHTLQLASTGSRERISAQHSCVSFAFFAFVPQSALRSARCASIWARVFATRSVPTLDPSPPQVHSVKSHMNHPRCRSAQSYFAVIDPSGQHSLQRGNPRARTAPISSKSLSAETAGARLWMRSIRRSVQLMFVPTVQSEPGR